MRVSVDGAAIDVAIEGDGKPVILLHGFPLTRDIWEPQRALASRLRVLRPDLRGMGKSRGGPGPYLMESLAGDVASVLDAGGIDRCAIVGHSAGGYVALAFARMFTERVAALALVCSRLRSDSPDIAAAREALAERLENEGTIEPALEAYLPKLLARNVSQQRVELLERARRIAQNNTPTGLAAMLRGMAMRSDSMDIAPELTMPVLIVAGASDQIVTEQESGEMRDAFPNADLRVISNSGHLPMLEAPQALTEALDAFLR